LGFGDPHMSVREQPEPEIPVIAEGLFSYQIGGSERVGVDLALEFSRRGYRVVCFAFYDSDGPMRAELERSGIRCLDMNYEKFRGLSRRVSYQWNFLQMLRRERITSLHVHHATALILCGIPAALASVRRVVMTEHAIYQLKERPDYRRSATRYCRYAHEITVVEPTQVDYFRDEMHVPPSKLHYVPNGVRLGAKSPENAARMRRELRIPADAFAFFYVGRLSPVKDLGTLLQALALVRANSPKDIRLCVVGEGTERAALAQQCVALGLQSQVMFLGARDNVSDLLAAGDAFVMSSRTEGLPMALLEAMAAEVPCVASAVGGIPELLADNRGLLAPPRDPARLAEQMVVLLSSPTLRAQLASNATARVREHYSLDVVADRYLDLLGLAHAAEKPDRGDIARSPG
jgi:glycosyltransferase involved in cell wall biosynthesis